MHAWRERMQTGNARSLLQQRRGIAETPNADLGTHRSLDRMLVRGRGTVTNVMLIGAITYNLMLFVETLIGGPMPPLD